MALTQAELEQCKYWLGYGNLTALARPYVNISVFFEDVAQRYLDGTWAEGYVRNTILPNLTAAEAAIQTQVTLQAQATELVGDVKIDANNAFGALYRLINYWKDRLSAIFMIPRNDLPGNGSGNTITVM